MHLTEIWLVVYALWWLPAGHLAYSAMVLRPQLLMEITLADGRESYPVVSISCLLCSSYEIVRPVGRARI